jgi:hypothetical protein
MSTNGTGVQNASGNSEEGCYRSGDHARHSDTVIGAVNGGLVL